MKATAAIGVLLAFSTAASADVLVNQYVVIGTYGDPQYVDVFWEGRVSTAAGLMDRCRVELYTPSGSKVGVITAVDLSVEADTGQVFQIGFPYVPPLGRYTPDMKQAIKLGPELLLQDSHFLLNPDGSSWGAANEDNDWSAGGGAGFGDLRALGIIGEAYRAARLPFVQVVVPAGTTAVFNDFLGGVADYRGELWSLKGLAIGIPEPAAVVVFAAGGATLLGRRRNRTA